MKVRVVLADDHEIVRDGLRTLLQKERNISVIDEARNGREAVELARKLSPDIVVMDVTMPDLNGIEATRRIVAKSHNVKVIALSVHSDRRFVIEMFKAGASGYLLKDCAFEELVRAINAVIKNHRYVSPNIANVVIDGYLQITTPDERSAFSVLSPREREVLQLISEGFSTKKIANRLHVSVKTIETHRRQIMNKLDIHNVADLVKYAIREGLTSLES